eukprot:TRINITY_DN877_c0_g3_i1.p1 TRINITY_DN877_c0_g3~~TRINITY_DN877_c0_g3_i1.p1  ORF type:complete len:1387 (-),score=537.00 TRINITY_DN877_c0_g3_i1:3078-7238(-)
MTLDIKDSVFRMYEEYVLKDKDLEQGAKGLIATSEDYRYLKCMDLLTKKKLNLDKNELEYVKEYVESDRSRKGGKVRIRLCMLEYDAAKTKEEKNKVLDKISKEVLSLRFEHQKPGHLGSKAEAEETKAKKKEEKVLESVKLDEYLDKLYKRQMQPSKFSKRALLQADLEKLHKDDFFSMLHFLEKDLPMLDGKKLCELLEKHTKDSYNKSSESYNIDSSIYENMTLEQLDMLKSKLAHLDKDENFMFSYIEKKFAKELDEVKNLHCSNEEKHKCLVKLYDYAKNLPQKLSGFKSWVLLDLLQVGVKTSSYDEGYFMEYLKAPANQPYLRKPVTQTARWRYLLASLNVDMLRDRELLTSYLEYFFLKGTKMNKFEEYLDNRFLNEVWEDTMLMAGKEVEMNARNSERLESLGSKVRIKLQPDNKECFKVGEEVKVKVELKNVPTLFVKVFEINLENYYRKNMDYFKSDINLDGLVASVERTLEQKEPPHMRVFKELDFPELKGKVGLYVIELIGNGKSSRAVIEIGSLSLISYETAAGQICYILDGERNVCCHESTGIWMNNAYFKADVAKKGRIVVPFHPSGGTTVKAVLLHQGLARLVDFTRKEENYSFKCGFYLLPESVIMGKNADIIIRPHLTVNGKTATLNLLKNITCTLSTSSYVDNIPATKTFDNLALSDNGELIISFQVAPNIDSLSININAEIQNISKNSKQALSDSHSFCISNHKNDEAIGEFYLELDDKSDYKVSLLGKNGEPIKDASVMLTYTTDLCDESKNVHVETNDQGSISLGKMKGVTTLKALFNQTNRVRVAKAWKLPSQSVMQYPEYMDIIEGETVEFPVSLEDAKNPYLFRSRHLGKNIENFTKLVKVERKDKNLYSTATIKDLKAGEYLLTGFGNDTIKIQVHEGVYWKENKRFIMKEYSMVENEEREGFVKIKSIDFEDKKEGKSQMHIEIDSPEKANWRVHVLLFKYLPEDLDALTLRLLAKNRHTVSEHFFKRWKNLYLAERELGTELRYCFDRRNQERFVGNTLEKPKLVLKRNFLKSTSTLEEKVTEGTKYESRSEPRDMVEKAAYSSQMETGGGTRGVGKGMRMMCHRYGGEMDVKPDEDRVSTYQNFLALEPLVSANCMGNHEGKLSIELDNKFREGYGCALVLAVGRGSAAHYLLPLPGTNLQKRDLSLLNPLAAEKSYSEVRSTRCLEKLETYTVDDIASTSIQLIDSLDKVALVNRILLNLDNRNIEHLDKFEKLLKWETMGEEEKNKMTSRYGSHELHLFLYKKDPEYFNKVIRSYLLNKMEKTFTDYYLLEDFDMMVKYANTPELFTMMHYLEKALLAERLALGGKTELAKTIAQRMKDWLLILRKDLARQNRIFNAVLSLGELTTQEERKPLI